MIVHCLLGKHAPLEFEAHNQGFAFTRCACCGTDLIGTRGKWREVPRGFRVAWRSRSQSSREPDAQLVFQFTKASAALVPVAAEAPAPATGPRLAERLLSVLRRCAAAVTRFLQAPLALTPFTKAEQGLLRLPPPGDRPRG